MNTFSSWSNNLKRGELWVVSRESCACFRLYHFRRFQPSQPKKNLVFPIPKYWLFCFNSTPLVTCSGLPIQNNSKSESFSKHGHKIPVIPLDWGAVRRSCNVCRPLIYKVDQVKIIQANSSIPNISVRPRLNIEQSTMCRSNNLDIRALGDKAISR